MFYLNQANKFTNLSQIAIYHCYLDLLLFISLPSTALLPVRWPLQTDQLQRNTADLHRLLDVLHRPGGSKWSFSHLISSRSNPSLSALPWYHLVCGQVEAKACIHPDQLCLLSWEVCGGLLLSQHPQGQEANTLSDNLLPARSSHIVVLELVHVCVFVIGCTSSLQHTLFSFCQIDG